MGRLGLVEALAGLAKDCRAEIQWDEVVCCLYLTEAEATYEAAYKVTWTVVAVRTTLPACRAMGRALQVGIAAQHSSNRRPENIEHLAYTQC
jgi:hypothetical protein